MRPGLDSADDSGLAEAAVETSVRWTIIRHAANV